MVAFSTFHVGPEYRAPRGKREQDSCKLLVTISLTDQYIALFYVHLFKDALFNMYCCFVSTKLTANITVTHA